MKKRFLPSCNTLAQSALLFGCLSIATFAVEPIKISGTLYSKISQGYESGVQSVDFTLYSDDGVRLWSDEILVSFVNGRYSVTLGQTADNLLPEDLNIRTTVLGVKVDKQDELLPRLSLVSTYAREAGNVKGDITPRSISISTDSGILPLVDKNGMWIGPEGNTGEAGPEGPIGPQGDIGATGPAGDTGATGLSGLQGPKGDTGVMGQAGPEGRNGDMGATGMKGDPGAAGPIGIQGIPGDNILSGYYGVYTGGSAAGSGPLDCTLGEMILFAGEVGNGIPANGQLLAINQYPELFSVIINKYGGDGMSTFQMPDMRPITPNGMTWFICDQGAYPVKR